MKPYRITTDLYTLPGKIRRRNIIYAPCLGVVLQADNAAMELISDIENLDYESLSDEKRAMLDYYIQKGIVNGDDTFRIKEENTVAEKLTLFPTNNCNLRCRYCYAGKCQSAVKTMDIKTAVNAIHNHGKILKKNDRSRFTLELHGGGEPFFEFELVKEIVNYLEKYCTIQNFNLEIAASTNGVLSEDKRNWIKNHISSLLISFDGLPEIQDYHRPFPDNSPTFSEVDETIKYFDRNNFRYAIRTTVSNRNIKLLKETIVFISGNYNTRLVFLEPVNECGGFMLNHELTCDLSEFGKSYLEVEKYAATKNIRTIYSGANLERLSSHFCYVGTNQFAVTPDGYLTNCWEVTSKDHPHAGTFIVGCVDENGNFKMYKEKIDHLKSFSVEQITFCKDCFAKWHCSGDCTMRSIVRNSGRHVGYRCESTRYVMNQKLLSILKDDTSPD